MTANDWIRVLAIGLIVAAIVGLERSKSGVAKVIGLVALAILLLDVTTWMPKFSQAVTAAQNWFLNLRNGGVTSGQA